MQRGQGSAQDHPFFADTPKAIGRLLNSERGQVEIKFNREPYTVRYSQNGEQKTYTRRPPSKLHEILPSDVVVLTQSKNDDFRAGQEFTVKHINQRQPNVLQVTDKKGFSTFVDYFDLRLEEMVARRDGVDPRDFPQNNRYLLWP